MGLQLCSDLLPVGIDTAAASATPLLVPAAGPSLPTASTLLTIPALVAAPDLATVEM